MQLNDLLSPDSIEICTEAKNKKRVLECIAKLVCCQLQDENCETDIFASYFARERLGSTAIGHGIAIPHIRCSQVSKSTGALLY